MDPDQLGPNSTDDKSSLGDDGSLIGGSLVSDRSTRDRDTGDRDPRDRNSAENESHVPPLRMATSGFSRIPPLIVSLRWISLVAGLLIFLLAIFAKPEVPTGRSIEKMFGSRDPSVQSYRQIKEIFGDQETILVVYRDTELFSPSGVGLQRLQSLARKVEAIEQVEEVLSLDRLEQALSVINTLANPLSAFTPNNHSTAVILDPDNRLAQSFLKTFDGWTHNKETDLAVLVCLISSPAKQANPEQTKETVRQLRALVADFSEAHVVGEPVMVEDGLSYLQQDGRWLQYGAMVLLGGVILLMLRTVKWLIVTACVVLWANVVTRWVLALLSFEQSMISSLLGSIIAVIGVATTIHLVVGYRVRRVSGESRSLAMREAVVRLLPPIFWACMTDAAGFTSLYVANVKAVRDFGLMMAIASLVTFLSICILTPGLILIGPRERSATTGVGQHWIEQALQQILAWVQRYPSLVSSVILSACGVAAAGFFFVQVETDFTKNFREDTPIMEGYRFVENQFGGAGLIDIAVKTPQALDKKFLARVTEFQQKLSEIPKFESREASAANDNVPVDVDGHALIPRPAALAKVVSLVDAITAAKVLPAVQVLPADTIVSGMRQVLPGFTNHWYHWDAQKKVGYLRIFARTGQQQSAEAKGVLIAEINRLAEQYFGADQVEINQQAQALGNEPLPGASSERASQVRTAPLSGKESATAPSNLEPGPRYLVTGMFVLLTRLVDSLLADHLATTLTATIVIGLLLVLALRHWSLAIIALVPNVLPILVLLGMLGWLGIKINMGVAMIAAVSIGLSVDSSIHYLWSIRRARLDAMHTGIEQEQSIEKAQMRIGTALTYSSITLIIGFLSLTGSQFVPTVYFGSLVSAAMFGGLLGNLVLLPAMLKLVLPKG